MFTSGYNSIVCLNRTLNRQLNGRPNQRLNAGRTSHWYDRKYDICHREIVASFLVSFGLW